MNGWKKLAAVTAATAGLVAGTGATASASPVVMSTPKMVSVDHNVLTGALHEAVVRFLDFNTVLPAEGLFTSGFGPRWGAMHNGIDIAAPIGTPILAVQRGEIIEAGPELGYGQWVKVLHPDGAVSVYGHVETIDVVIGQTVRAGEKIAGMGNRGFSTGSHLHFEIHPDGHTPVDPTVWLAERGIHL